MRRQRSAPAIAPDSTEDVVLRLLWVLKGDGGKDRGLMSHIVNGEQHIERCQRGMWITPGLRGDPCSARCQRAQDAIALAARWLYERRPLQQDRVQAVRQADMFEQQGVAG